MELYKAYRPQTLDAVIGNAGVIKSIKGLKEIPHAILMAGPSGCGKTTIARIIATEMLECSEEDYKEVDSGDFRGIDTIREVRKQMVYSPVKGKVRVWVIDECHQLSNDAQNAFLKALEDTPPHVYFILCTTNPEKLLKTIRTRCTSFEVQALEPEEIVEGLLKPVCRKENVKPPLPVLNQIARDSLGSSRSALVILGKILHLDPADMAEAASQMAAQESQTIELCRILLRKGSWKEVSAIVRTLTDEPESIRRAILGYMSAVLQNKPDDRAYNIMTCFAKNYFDSGKAGLIMSCYDATTGD